MNHHPSTVSPRPGPSWLGLVVFALFYFAAAIWSRDLTFKWPYAPLWLPSGITLGAFAFHGRRHWPALLAAAGAASLVFNLFVQHHPPVALIGFSLANTARTLISALLLQRILPGRLRLDEPRQVIAFAIIGGVIGPLLSAILGGLTLQIAYGTPALASMPNWFTGNMVGMMVASPPTVLLLQARRAWLRRTQLAGSNGSAQQTTDAPAGRLSPNQIREAALLIGLLGLTFAVACLVFLTHSAPLSYLVLPCLLWLAIRFEALGVCLGMLVVTAVTLAGTRAGMGDFADPSEMSTRLVIAQMFLTVCSLSFLTLAASLRQRRRLIEKNERTQLRLSALQRESQLILDTIPSMIVHRDQNNRLRCVNQAASAMLSEQELATLSMPIPVPTDGRSPSGEAFDQAQATGVAPPSPSVRHREELISLADGRKRWLLTDRVPLVTDEGHSLGQVTVMRDITDRKLVEQALATSNEDLDRFAAIASHDLKEPLRAVSGYCRMLLEDYGDRLDEEGLRFVRSAIEGAQRMDRLVEGLLEFSRVSQHRMPLATVELDRVLQTACSNLQLAIRESEAELTIGPLPSVTGSFGPLVQTFQNLLSNAIRFTKPGERPIIIVEATRLGDETVIRVTDRGIGIPAKDQASVFEIFHRLHHRNDYDGTGLGLAICRRVIERHQGRIDIEPGSVDGTTFRLFFPTGPRPTLDCVP